MSHLEALSASDRSSPPKSSWVYQSIPRKPVPSQTTEQPATGSAPVTPRSVHDEKLNAPKRSFLLVWGWELSKLVAGRVYAGCYCWNSTPISETPSAELALPCVNQYCGFSLSHDCTCSFVGSLSVLYCAQGSLRSSLSLVSRLATMLTRRDS